MTCDCKFGPAEAIRPKFHNLRTITKLRSATISRQAGYNCKSAPTRQSRHHQNRTKRLDHGPLHAYCRAPTLPCRLMVRLRTLTPSIEVRILTGHPGISGGIRISPQPHSPSLLSSLQSRLFWRLAGVRGNFFLPWPHFLAPDARQWLEC